MTSIQNPKSKTQNLLLRPAVFLDRDGVLNEMVYDETHGLLDSPRRADQVRGVPGAGAFLAELRRLGFFLCVVSNQPGLAKGTLTPAALDAVNRKLAECLAADGGAWDAWRFCPHHPEGGPGGNPAWIKRCDCRKPAPGLLTRAAQEYGLDPRCSWMVGDGLNDVQAGHAAGCRTVLLTRLKIEQIERFFSLPDALPTAVAPDFSSALAVIRKAV